MHRGRALADLEADPNLINLVHFVNLVIPANSVHLTIGGWTKLAVMTKFIKFIKLIKFGSLFRLARTYFGMLWHIWRPSQI